MFRLLRSNGKLRRIIVDLESKVSEYELCRREGETELKRAEALLNLTVHKGTDEKDFLTTVAAISRKLTESECSIVQLLNVDGDESDVTVTSFEADPASHQQPLREPVLGDWAESLCTQTELIVNDEGRLGSKGPGETSATLSRLMTIPVSDDGRVVLRIGVGNKKTN